MKKSLSSGSRSLEFLWFSSLLKQRQGILADQGLQAWHNVANAHGRKQHCWQERKEMELSTHQHAKFTGKLKEPPCLASSLHPTRTPQHSICFQPPCGVAAKSHVASPTPSTPLPQPSHTSGCANSWARGRPSGGGQVLGWGLQGAGNYHRVVLCHQAKLIHPNETYHLLSINIFAVHIQIPAVIVYLKTRKDTYSHSCPPPSAPSPGSLMALIHGDTHRLGHHHSLPLST